MRREDLTLEGPAVDALEERRVHEDLSDDRSSGLGVAAQLDLDDGQLPIRLDGNKVGVAGAQRDLSTHDDQRRVARQGKQLWRLFNEIAALS